MQRSPIVAFRKSPAVLAVLAMMGIFFSSARARASDPFPGAVRDDLDMPCLPTCFLCHITNPGEAGSAQQPFADSMVNAAGIPSPGDTNWVTAGLAALGDTDTDVDGMSDIDELKAGRDPNVKGEGDICAPEVKYGCGAAHVSAAPPTDLGGAAWFVLGGLVLAGVARTRRSAHN